jgi:osmotically-inducible protein OsmY
MKARWGEFAGLLGLALWLGGAVGARADADLDLQKRIAARLERAGFEAKADIQVTVRDGVARLTGIALLYADARAARRIARREARAVENLVRVVPETPRPDRDVRQDVEKRVLRWERYGPNDAVAAEVQDGVVSLHGWVDTPTKKGEVEDRIAGVDGVRDVHNDLRLQGFSQGDVRLRQQIFNSIYGDPMFESWRGQPDPPVRVFVSRGRVTLAGTVGSAVEQVRVGMIARGTLAFTVDNEVQVAGDKARREDRKKGDSES